MMGLSCLKRGQGGRVGRLRARDGLRRRLMDLGFTPGAQVEYLFSAPGGGMRAYRVRGAAVALRLGEARAIFLKEDAP